jgi:hypothetical protein
VGTLARAAAALLAQVQSLDGEVSALAHNLRVEGASQQLDTLHGDALLEGTSATEEEPETAPQRPEDLDGARLVALNMALSGESREQTDRYLADSFQLSDRAKLLDEVYAAVEG